MQNKLPRHPNLTKALDHAIWLNFNHRAEAKKFGVIQSSDDGYLVIPTDHPTFKGEQFEKLPKDYSNISYEHLKMIGMDDNYVGMWEELRGVFSTMNGELMKFILHTKIPLKRLIRWELANRGFDMNNNWIGFDASYRLWLKN